MVRTSLNTTPRGSSRARQPPAEPEIAESSRGKKNYQVIDGKSLVQSDLPSEINAMLVFQGLWNVFLSICQPTFYKLVIEFYAKMKVAKSRDGVKVTSVVRGRTIEITPRNLSSWLNMSLEGVSDYFRDKWIEVNNASWDNYLAYMMGKEEVDDLSSNERPNKTMLSGEQRLLSIIVSEILLPVRNRSNLLGMIECTFAYCLKHRIKFNFPVLILEHMSSCKRANRVHLPYGQLISWILQKKYSINVAGEPTKMTARSILSAKNLRFFDLFQVEGRYLSLHEINQLPSAERKDIYTRLSISRKRRRTVMEELSSSEEDTTIAAAPSSGPPCTALVVYSPSAGPSRAPPTSPPRAASTGSSSDSRGEIRWPRTKLINPLKNAITHMQRSIDKGFASLNKQMRKFNRRLSCIERALNVDVPLVDLPSPSASSSSDS